jgi:hypothetical protein
MGSADSFAVLAGAGITNTGLTSITGDVGSSPTPSETGFDSVVLLGTNHKGDAVTQAAKGDLAVSYAAAVNRSGANEIAGALGGSTLGPGVYKNISFGVSGTLILDARGNTNAAFIFQSGSTVIAEVNSRILLVNGADPCNVVWQVGSSATFKAGAHFVGNVFVHSSVTAGVGASFLGRLLAQDGAVTLDANTITKTTCAVPPRVAGPSGNPVSPISPGGLPPAVPGASKALILPLIAGPPASAAPNESADGDPKPVGWALISPHENPAAGESPSPPLLAAVGAHADALARTALILLGLSVVAAALLIARRRQRRRQSSP